MSDHDTTTTQNTRPPSIAVANFKAISAGAMIGVCDVTLPSGMVLLRCSLFCKDDRVWAAPPSKQVIGRNGNVQKDSNGKTRYEPTVLFIDRGTEQRWSAVVVAAFREAYPEAIA